jgi:hypothetical protein
MVALVLVPGSGRVPVPDGIVEGLGVAVVPSGMDTKNRRLPLKETAV